MRSEPFVAGMRRERFGVISHDVIGQEFSQPCREFHGFKVAHDVCRASASLAGGKEWQAVRLPYKFICRSRYDNAEPAPFASGALRLSEKSLVYSRPRRRIL